MTQHPRVGTLAVVPRGEAVLMVERGRDPNRGLWGFPGGHVEWGETAREAAARECLEETGVAVTPRRYLGSLDVIGRDEAGKVTWHYLLTAVWCDWAAGEPVAADDAADARWVTPGDIAALPTTANVDRVLDWLRAAQAEAKNRPAGI